MPAGAVGRRARAWLVSAAPRSWSSPRMTSAFPRDATPAFSWPPSAGEGARATPPAQSDRAPTARSYTLRLVTRASLLVNGPPHAVQAGVAGAQQRGVPLGLHLNLTELAPVSACGAVPSLLLHASGCACDAAAECRCAVHGCTMRGKFGFRDALAAGAIDLAHVQVRARSEDDEREREELARAAPAV